MTSGPKAAEFDIAEARRVLGDVFAPWVQDLGLTVDSIETAPRPRHPPTGNRAPCYAWRFPTGYAGMAASSADRR